MQFHPFARRLLALVLTAAFMTAAALSSFAVYAMPIQAAYPQESIYLFDADTGEALVEQNPDLPRCVASLTKMMTALLVLESGTDLSAGITIPASLTPELQSIRANRGHTIGLQAGETVRRIDMMYAMLLPSANDAASVLAVDTSGSLAAFAAQMNVRASQLGCTATHFTCPHGLYDGGNYYIKNVNITSHCYNVGLFGTTAGAEIKNIVLYSDNDAVIQRKTDATPASGGARPRRAAGSDPAHQEGHRAGHGR